MALAAVLAASIPGPSLLWDGQGYLGAARWLAGDRAPWLGSLAFYHPAYGALLAPAVWLGASPMGLFRWAQAVNVAAIVVAAVALGALARTLLPEGRTWIAATAAAVAYPALALQAGYEWPEAPFAALFAAAAVAAWRERHLALAVASVGLFALHPRAVGVIVVTGVLLAAARRWRPLAVVVAGTAAVQVLNRLALDALYDPGRRSAARSALDTMTDPSQWGDVVLRATGHAWYLLVATVGLAGVAVWALARERRPGARWLLAAVLAVLAASAVQLSGRGRTDHLVYGRYVEAVAPVLIVVAARWLAPLRVAAALAVAAVLGVATVAGNGSGSFGGEVAWINVPVLAAVRPEIDVAAATAAAGVAGLLVAFLATRARGAALAVLAAAGLAVAAFVHLVELDDFARRANDAYVMGDDVARFADGGTVAFDRRAYGLLAANRYQWQHPDLDLLLWRDGTPPSSSIVGRKGPPPVDGARVVAAEPANDLALWVAPGRAQDELAARGWLVLGNGEPVGDGFYRAEVERVGERHVRVTHAGTGAPWVPDGELPGDVGLVRVHIGSESTRLPGIVRPGESVLVPVWPWTTTVELEHVHHRSFGTFDVAGTRSAGR